MPDQSQFSKIEPSSPRDGVTVQVPNFYAVILTAVTTRELRGDVIQKLLLGKFTMEAMIVIQDKVAN